MFNYWADMSNDDISIQHLKNDDDFDDDIDVMDWKEPEKKVLNSPKEEEGMAIMLFGLWKKNHFLFI